MSDLSHISSKPTANGVALYDKNGAQILEYDGVHRRINIPDGSSINGSTSDVASITVRNTSGGTLTAGTLVYISGWDHATGYPLVNKADADASGKPSQYIVSADIANNANGTAVKSLLLTGLNTNAGNAGDPVYLSATAGGWTLTAPTAVNARVQIVGYIDVKSATVGKIQFNLSQAISVSFGTNELANGGILTLVAGMKLASGVHVMASASDTVATGLATVTSAIVSFQDAPTANIFAVAADVGNQSGAPVAGSVLLKAYKTPATPTGATTFSDNIHVGWVALGT